MGGQGAEAAGDFGAQAVADAVLAAGEAADEEGDAVVAEFDVGAQLVAVVAALRAATGSEPAAFMSSNMMYS